jgi:hypothetical protein
MGPDSDLCLPKRKWTKRWSESHPLEYRTANPFAITNHPITSKAFVVNRGRWWREILRNTAGADSKQIENQHFPPSSDLLHVNIYQQIHKNSPEAVSSAFNMSSRASAASSILGKSTPNTISKPKKSTPSLKLVGGDKEGTESKMLVMKAKLVAQNWVGGKIQTGNSITLQSSVTGRSPTSPNAWGTRPVISTTDKTQDASDKFQNIALKSQPGSVVSNSGRKVQPEPTNQGRKLNDVALQGRDPLNISYNGSNLAPRRTSRSVYEGNRPYDCKLPNSSWNNRIRLL